MPCQLAYDCLNYIFEYLHDENTLYSCLLVNSLCCEIAVRILWRNVWKFYDYNKPQISLSIINTLIAFLPKESKELLHKNCITIPIQKPPLFNYASFCKIISIYKIKVMTSQTLEKQQLIISEGLENVKYLLSQEILKMFMNQISSLKALECNSRYTEDFKFIYSPRAKICLANLTRLECDSDLSSEFFYQISQICHNIQSLYIGFIYHISNGLADLISLQNNLKIVMLVGGFRNKFFDKTISSLVSKNSFSLTKLTLFECDANLSFIAVFKNLQELNLYHQDFNNSNFDQLQYIHFLQLKILKIICDEFSKVDIKMLINFLEINGKILTQFNIYGYYDDSLNMALAKFCPNLKNLCTAFKKNESETLKLILNNCQYLEIIKVRYGDKLFNDKTIFKVLANYSQKYFYGLILDCYYSKIVDKLHEELEEFFINWQDRISQRSLSLIIYTGFSNNVISEVNGKDMKTIIDKYMKLGIIKKFETEECGFINPYSEFRTSI